PSARIMRKPRLLPAVALACTGLVIFAGCGDITNPVTTPLAKSSNAVVFSNDGTGSEDNQYAHAIHVRTTSIVLSPRAVVGLSPTTVVDEYTFFGVRHGDDVNGKWEFRQLRGVGESQTTVVASGTIVCLQVEGNKARVGGRVEATSFPEGIPVGSEITWSVTDNGKSANADDSASQPLGNAAQAYCRLGLAYAESPVERGKIQVRD